MLFEWVAGQGDLVSLKLMSKLKHYSKQVLSDALIEASYNGHTETVKWLLDEGADPKADDYTALILACRGNHFEIVQWLVYRGASVNGLYGEPLLSACFGGYYDIVKYLVENGADISVNDYGPKRIAKQQGHRFITYFFDSIEHIRYM